MSYSLQKEFSTLSGFAALGFLARGNKKWATYSGLLSLGLRAFRPSLYSFQEKSVVITGGSRGLGLALAKELILNGAYVTLLARDDEELKQAQNILKKKFAVKVHIENCDVTSRTQLRSTFTKIIQRFGKIDVLVNNAGSVSAGPFESMDQKDFEAQMNLHFFAPLKAIQTVLPEMKENGGGVIINISSIGGRIPVPHMSPYAASKFALAGFSETISTELAKDQIRITTVYPGLMRTGSPIQGVFKGDHEKEFAWFAISDSMPGLTLSAKCAARRIVNAVEQGETSVVLSVPAKLGSFVYANFPGIFHLSMSLVNQLLPQGLSDDRQTGAASRAWLFSKPWAQPFRWILQRAQHQYNEREKFDAAFNLNVH